MREQENYAQSIQYSIDRVKASLEELAYDTLNSGFIKAVVEGANDVLQLLDQIIEKADGIPGIITAITSTFFALKGGGLNWSIDSLTGKNTFSILGKQIGGAFSKSEISLVEQFLSTLDEGDDVAQKLSTSMVGLSDSTKNYVIQTANAGKSSTEIVNGMKKANSASGILATSLKSLGTTIVSVAATMAIGFAIEKTITGLYKLATLTSRYNEEIKSLNNSYTDTKNDIDAYKEKIEKLQKIINNSNSSYEDSKAAREQLMQIQDELISKYGSEEEAIRNITDAVWGEVSALDALNEKRWTETKNRMSNPKSNNIEDVIDFEAYKAFHGGNTPYEQAVSDMKMANTSKLSLGNTSVLKEDAELLKKIVDLYDDINLSVVSNNYDDAKKDLVLYGDTWDGFYNDLLKVQKAAEQLGASDDLNKYLSNVANQTNQLISDKGGFWQNYVENELISKNGDYSKLVDEVTQAGRQYKEAFNKGFKNDEEKQSALSQYADVYLNALKNIDDDEVRQYLKNIYPDLESEVSQWKFDLNFDANTDNLQDELRNKIELFKDANYDVLSYEDLINFDASIYEEDDERLQVYNELIALADKYGVSIQHVIDKLKEEKLVESESYQKLVSKFGQSNIDSLSQEEIEIAYQFIDNTNSFEELKSKIAEVQEIKIEPEVKLSITDFSNSLKGIKKLTSLYKTWKQQVENNPTKVSLDITEVESALRSLGEKEGIDISNIVGSEEFENFERIVGDSASTAQQVQAAFDSLGEVIVENTVDLSKLTEENAALVQSQLESVGVTNAEAVVKDRLAQITQEAATQEAFLAEKAELASGATYREAASCAELAGATEITRNAVFLLVAQEEILGNTDLNIDDKVAAISELASAHLSAANAARVHAYAEQLQANASHYGLSGSGASSYFDSMMNQYLNNMEELSTAAVKVQVDLSGLGGAGSAAGKGAGKAADGMKDAADAANEASSAIDQLQDAYQKLKKIQESYNKTGKLTVDQAQELMQMDFRYLAMLKNENGAISVNEQAFENLTRIKLEEMRVTMMRNALNTMQSITTEAQAEAYLALCTGEANMAATEAVAIQAALEAQMHGATGAIAEAYNMIYQGLQNAMAMLGEGFGNVDFSSLAGAAENATEGVADNAQEEFEKVYDWLERRMNVLQKKAELFAAKRANADKTYYSRYSGANLLFNQEITVKKQQRETAKEQVKAYEAEYKKAIEGLDAETIAAIEGNGHSIQTITDKTMSEAIDKAIEWKDKWDQAKITVEEMQTAINDLAVEKIEYLGEVFEHKMKKVRRAIDFSEFGISVMDTKGYSPTSGLYTQLAKEYEQLAYKQTTKLMRMETKRAQMIASGTLTENSEQDLKLQEEIYSIQQEVLDTQQKQVQAEKDARDAVQQRFEFLQQIQDSYEDELNSINGLFNSDAAIDDEARYTSTAYGMMATQYYNYESNIKQVEVYEKRLDDLRKSYERGEMGATEYYEAEQNMRSEMYASAEAAKEAKDAIVDLAKERIEKEIDIIEEQIKAYKELIDKQKEALKSTKDLHDYQKSLAETQKDIVKIERQLAAIENDNSLKAIATRRQLEEKLADARQKLEDKQYDHSISSAEKALDAQAKAYEEAKNVEIKRLEEKLKDVDALFKEATNGLATHMSDAMEGITNTLSEYGVKMSDIISNAIITGIKTGSTAANEFLSGIGGVQGNFESRTEAEAETEANANKRAQVKQELATYAGEIKDMFTKKNNKKIISDKEFAKYINATKSSYSLNAIANLIAKNNFSEAYKKTGELITKLKEHKNSSKLQDLIKALRKYRDKIKAGYATGVHNLNKDEIAWTQEYGREAILSPTRNAILTPLKAGDSVLTKEQTENLFKIAQNPADYFGKLFNLQKPKGISTNNNIVMKIDNVLTVQGDVNNSNAKEISEIAQKAITKAFNDFSSKIKK